MPAMGLIALCIVLVQVGNDEEVYYLVKGGDNPNNELTRKKRVCSDKGNLHSSISSPC
jgi:hypothetical protein